MARRRRRSDRTEDDGIAEFMKALVELAARYPLVGNLLAIILAITCAILVRKPGIYPLLGWVAGFMGAVFIVVAGIGSLLQRLDTNAFKKPPSEIAPPYRARASLLTPGEAAFFPALRSAVHPRHLIFAHVRLCDLLEDIPRSEAGAWTAFNRVSRKHVDFVICDQERFRPLLVIELDDRSHQRAKRAESDRTKDDVLRQAGITILHIPCERAYDVQQLREQIASSLEIGFPTDVRRRGLPTPR